MTDLGELLEAVRKEHGFPGLAAAATRGDRIFAEGVAGIRRVGKDDLSRVQFLIGSSGVPETFVIDGKGVIRHQHIGEIRPEDVPDLLRRLAEARG